MKLLSKNMDWRYFKIAFLVSGMYIFNMIVIATLHVDTGLTNSAIYLRIANAPLLTLAYIGTLFELLGMKILTGAAISRLRRNGIFHLFPRAQTTICE